MDPRIHIFYYEPYFLYCREWEFHVPPAPYRRQKKVATRYGGIIEVELDV